VATERSDGYRQDPDPEHPGDERTCMVPHMRRIGCRWAVSPLTLEEMEQALQEDIEALPPGSSRRAAPRPVCAS
jgi:hypothetical protein